MDLTADGYVKLDGIDVEALRQAVERWDSQNMMTLHPPIMDVARQVLAALDPQENTDE
jgi:hypothetical protein